MRRKLTYLTYTAACRALEWLFEAIYPNDIDFVECAHCGHAFSVYEPSPEFVCYDCEQDYYPPREYWEAVSDAQD